jgi:hypothetical protein
MVNPASPAGPVNRGMGVETIVRIVNRYLVTPENVQMRSDQPHPDKSRLATKDEISAFTCSANRPDVGGLGARHARINGGLPKQTMTELQAREFIGRLLCAWMDALV